MSKGKLDTAAFALLHGEDGLNLTSSPIDSYWKKTELNKIALVFIDDDRLGDACLDFQADRDFDTIPTFKRFKKTRL